ncbi:PAS domain S-box protein [Sphingomonas sp. AOB5]|uniref:two-component system sensor histidine kinase NtrB n=1 Tax=Sphingomonas sp. AOB5 TaxID=3034017 RepID=UPI0023F77E9E|nr:PAS domain S-box protein [Sphingomonas sp. AOB5]MDF7775813.1 PAS domain S-box protein [Sphingomonas sp. AOB5]
MLRQALAALSGSKAGDPSSTVDLRLEASFEQAAVGMAHVALDGRWLRVNDQCSAIIGYSKDELLGGSFQHITHPEDLPHDLAQVERLLCGEAERYSMDKRYIRKDGGSVWVHLTVTLIRDKDGAPDFFVVVIQDISDRKHVEASLVDSEARYRAIFDSAVEAIAVIDSRGTIQSINPAAQRIFGYAPAELIGNNVRTLMPKRIAREHDAYLNRYRTTHERAIIGIGREVEGMRKDGTPLSIDLSVAEWERAGQTFFTGIMRDITPRREAEAALRTSEERLRSLQNEYAHLARVNEMGEMAAAIAHEINQPLTAIVNNLNAGLYAGNEGLSQGAFEEAQEVMVAASVQALRAGEIVRRLREFVGKSTGERRIEAIDTLVDAASGLALIDAAANGIQVERLTGADGVQARVDTVQIQQVIVNLIRNAMDALVTLPPGQERRISIATKVIEKSSAVEIRIADTGPGIPEELRSTVFEPFFTSKAKGMGMGLSVCRRLIEAHDGSIALEAPGGAGAAFRLTLPQYRV